MKLIIWHILISEEGEDLEEDDDEDSFAEMKTIPRQNTIDGYEQVLLFNIFFIFLYYLYYFYYFYEAQCATDSARFVTTPM